MIDELPTVTFKAGWSRMERVLFLLTLVLVISVLTLCSAIIVILLGDVKLPRKILTPPTATTDFTFTSTPTVAMTTNTTIAGSRKTDTTHEKTTPPFTTMKSTTTTSKASTESPSSIKVCETRGCVVAAARVLQTMNQSAKPCDNFYQYACGSWIKFHPVEPQESDSIFNERIDDQTDRLQELLWSSNGPDEIDAVVKTKTIYASCTLESYINERSKANINYLIKTAGGLPLVDKNWKMDQSLEDFLIKLRRMFGVTPLLPVTIKMDVKNTSRNLIHIGSGSQVSSDDIVSPKKYGAHMNDPMYDQLATQLLKQFNISRKSVDNQIAEVGDFQRKFGIVKWKTRVNMDNVVEIYNPTTLGELQTNYTMFDWKYFLEGLLSTNGSNVTLPGDETIIMISKSYIGQLMALMNETQGSTIVNYAILSTIMHYKDPLGMNSQNLYSAKQTKKVRHSKYQEETRNAACVDVFVENFKDVLGWMYIRKYFQDDQSDIIAKITEMTNFVKNSVEKLLKETLWLGPKSKKYSLEKIKNLLEIIGYNNESMVPANVNNLFDGIQISRWNYFKNIIQIKARKNVMQLSKLGISPNRLAADDDGMFAVNAWYDSMVNTITIPAGVIRNPFFDIHSPMAMNFGSLGTIVGHELMHAYDDEGSLYDSNGNFFPWLSLADKEKFNLLSQSLAQQYSSFQIPNTDLWVNGNLTLGENIADNGGIKVTYKGYLSWMETSKQSDYRLPGLNLNPRQLFFLAFAQNWCSNFSPSAYEDQIRYDAHAPDVARVLLTLRNSKEFSSVYDCPEGSKMNPTKKFGLW